MTRAAVMGSGSWGTAFAMVLADAGTDVVALGAGRRARARRSTRRTRTRRTTRGSCCPEPSRRPPTWREALADADVVVLAVPSQVLRDNLAGWRAAPAPRLRARQPDEGHRAGHRRCG